MMACLTLKRRQILTKMTKLRLTQSRASSSALRRRHTLADSAIAQVEVVRQRFFLKNYTYRPGGWRTTLCMRVSCDSFRFLSHVIPVVRDLTSASRIPPTT